MRDIPLTIALAEKLKARKDAQETELIIAGLEPSEERMSQIYVLGEVDGSFMKPHGLWRPWKALADSMGLVGTQGRRPTFHDLRHTFATFAIAEGIDVKTVSRHDDRRGHGQEARPTGAEELRMTVQPCYGFSML